MIVMLQNYFGIDIRKCSRIGRQPYLQALSMSLGQEIHTLS